MQSWHTHGRIQNSVCPLMQASLLVNIGFWSVVIFYKFVIFKWYNEGNGHRTCLTSNETHRNKHHNLLKDVLHKVFAEITKVVVINQQILKEPKPSYKKCTVKLLASAKAILCKFMVRLLCLKFSADILYFNKLKYWRFHNAVFEVTELSRLLSNSCAFYLSIQPKFCFIPLKFFY